VRPSAPPLFIIIYCIVLRCYAKKHKRENESQVRYSATRPKAKRKPRKIQRKPGKRESQRRYSATRPKAKKNTAQTAASRSKKKIQRNGLSFYLENSLFLKSLWRSFK